MLRDSPTIRPSETTSPTLTQASSTPARGRSGAVGLPAARWPGTQGGQRLGAAEDRERRGGERRHARGGRKPAGARPGSRWPHGRQLTADSRRSCCVTLASDRPPTMPPMTAAPNRIDGRTCLRSTSSVAAVPECLVCARPHRTPPQVRLVQLPLPRVDERFELVRDRCGGMTPTEQEHQGGRFGVYGPPCGGRKQPGVFRRRSAGLLGVRDRSPWRPEGPVHR